jgi:toxin ParE1/3/4
MRVAYHPDAEAELIEAASYYEGRVSGLGGRFLQAFDAAIDTILYDPVEWPILEEDIRRYLLKRFPYGVLYSIDGDELQILAVMHLKRHPDYWKYRLGR